MKTRILLQLIVTGLILFTHTAILFAQINFKDLVGHSVLTYGDEGEWDDGYVWSPTIIKDGDTLRMWYYGSHDDLYNTTIGQIGYAWSLDGIEWNKYPDNPVLSATLDWEEDGVGSPVVIKDSDTLKMWYGGKKKGYAESFDGINWTKNPEPFTLEAGPQSEWDDGFLWVGTVIKEDNEYKMWYSGGRPGFPGEDAYPQVGLASSPDGLNWTKYDDPATQNAPYAFSDPVLTPGGEENNWDSIRAFFPVVIKTDTGYTMFYTGMKGPVSSEEKQQTGLAYSGDGIVWDKDEYNPIIKDDHSVVDWGRGIMSGAALHYNDRFHYWFCCEFTPPYWVRPQIGYATQLIPCYPESFDFTTQAEIDSFKSDYNNCNMVYGGVTINGDDISNLDGLSNLTLIRYKLKIGSYNEGCPSLLSLSGLENLTAIGILEIIYNSSLISLNGLNNLTSMWGYIDINSNSSLVNLTGLEGLNTIMELDISGNDALTSLSGLENLTKLIGAGQYGSELSIRDNDALESLTGLENLTSLGTGDEIPSEVSIEGNDALVSLQSIENIDAETVQNLYIHDNPSLSICDEKLICSILSDTITNVSIENNAPGCNSLEEVDEDCDNNCLPGGFSPYYQEDIDNFPSNYEGCNEILGNVYLSSSQIMNLDSLYVLDKISGDLRIYGSSNLTSLSGLENVIIGGNLTISNNENLSICDVEGICNYLNNPNGEINIESNADGCESSNQVLDSCGIDGIHENTFANKLSVNPNPFSTSTIFEYELHQTSSIQITIYNHLGKQIEMIEHNQSQGNQQFFWNAESLPAGIYFCVLKTESGMQTMKMIKLK